MACHKISENPILMPSALMGSSPYHYLCITCIWLTPHHTTCCCSAYHCHRTTARRSHLPPVTSNQSHLWEAWGSGHHLPCPLPSPGHCECIRQERQTAS